MVEAIDLAEFRGGEPMENQEYPYKAERRRQRKRRLLCCCGICTAIAIVIIVTIIILIFTLFKQKNPTIKVDSLTLRGLNVNLGNVFTSPNLEVDLDLLTKVTVKNPNYAGFNYKNTTAYIYYQGIDVAESAVPAGKVKSRSTGDLNSTTSVHITGSILNAQLLNDVNAGALPLVTTIQLQGTAKVLGFISVKNVRTSANCSLLVYIANQTQSYHCDYKTKL
jgi:LEA14-like dessication related protein